MAGDPDLFVSTTVTRPAADDRNSTWRSTEYGPDTLTIDPRTDPKACVHCTYYIAGTLLAAILIRCCAQY